MGCRVESSSDESSVQTKMNAAPPYTSRRSCTVVQCQDALLSVSAGVLDRAVNYSSWDSDDFTPTLELLDNVMGGYNASPAGIVGRDSLGEEPASM